MTVTRPTAVLNLVNLVMRDQDDRNLFLSVNVQKKNKTK